MIGHWPCLIVTSPVTGAEISSDAVVEDSRFGYNLHLTLNVNTCALERRDTRISAYIDVLWHFGLPHVVSRSRTFSLVRLVQPDMRGTPQPSRMRATVKSNPLADNYGTKRANLVGRAQSFYGSRSLCIRPSLSFRKAIRVSTVLGWQCPRRMSGLVACSGLLLYLIHRLSYCRDTDHRKLPVHRSIGVMRRIKTRFVVWEQ